MKIAFILYDGMSTLEFSEVYDGLTRLGEENLLPGLTWETAGLHTPVQDSHGLELIPQQLPPILAGYNLVVIPGGTASSASRAAPGLLDWLQTASEATWIAATGSGVLLLAEAGLLSGRQVSARAGIQTELQTLGVKVRQEPLVEDGKFLSASGSRAGIELGLALCTRLAGDAAANLIRQQMGMPPGSQASSGTPPAARQARVTRRTSETRVEITLGLDGQGIHQIHTGIPFLDHMLVQVAVHGLFDLAVQAAGDLEIDAHHTAEDTALALGQAFREALGDKAGITRMASVEVPMDESLGRVTLDFSGRPYAVIDAAWHGPMVGALPVTLIAHFFESFAFQAGCNLHGRIFYGRDDHHQAEALFKAFGRALDAATRLDSRQLGTIPSSKGSI